jgi:hypothetical protein
MADGRASGTVLLWLAIILCFMTLYFVISWIPKLSIEAGLSPKDGIYAGAIYNIGAFVGTSSVGLVAMRFDLRRVIFAYMVLAATALMIFGTVHMPLAMTLTTAFMIGVFVQGGFNGCYPLAAHFYPAHVRSADRLGHGHGAHRRGDRPDAGRTAAGHQGLAAGDLRRVCRARGGRPAHHDDPPRQRRLSPLLLKVSPHEHCIKRRRPCACRNLPVRPAGIGHRRFAQPFHA